MQRTFFTRRFLGLALGLAASLANAQSQVNVQQLLGAAQSMGLSGVLGSLPTGGLNLGAPQVPQVTNAADVGAQQVQDSLSAAGQGLAQGKAQEPLVQEIPTQFQRFVQQSTGQFLPHFGEALFKSASTFNVNVFKSAPAPDDYVLGPGDQVNIRLFGTVDGVFTQTLDRNGVITLSKVGTIALSGVKVRDLQPALQQHVSRVFKDVKVDAGLGKLRGVTVYVVGQAKAPGAYSLSSLSTMLNAIFASGGPSSTGSMRNIALMRGGKVVAQLDLYDFIVRGDKSRDSLLQPGDVISIPAAGARVALTGATDAAAIYELKDGSQETVQQLLAYSGGLGPLADHRKALLERLQPTQQASRQVISVDLAQGAASQALQGGDIVTLLQVSPAFANAVTLRGAVAQPMRQPWFKGMRVQDLIPDREALISPDYYRQRNALVQNRTADLRSQGLTPNQILAIERAQLSPQDLSLSEEMIRMNPRVQVPGDTQQGVGKDGVADGSAQLQSQGAQQQMQPSQTAPVVANWPKADEKIPGALDLRTKMRQINWDYAMVERLNKKDLRTEIIGFNLAKAVLDKEAVNNIELQPGDVVTVLSSSDIALPIERRSRTVRIEGEVAAPGLYEVQPGETLPQLVKRVGGLTPQAYLYGAEFTRESVRRQQQLNLDQAIRKLESQLQSAGATLSSNLTGDRAMQASTIQQQNQAQMRAQLDRLRVLRSKGRVALELDADNAYKAINAGQADLQRANAQLQSLPPVPLEDGDAFVVPTLPAFVSAVGAVNNENVFIYRPGRTVSDVIASAGLSEDADASNAFLLRADGTVISRGSSGWLSSFGGTRVMPGDTLVVPVLVDRESKYNGFVRGLKDWTQIISNFGVGVAAWKSLGY